MADKGKIDAAAILAACDIVQVIESQGVELKKAGAEFKACCPFHDEKTPSFTVIPAKQFYHCFGCGAAGDAIGFIKDYRRVSFKEACEYLAGGDLPMDSAPMKPAPARAKEVEPRSAWDPILPVPDNAPKPPRSHPFRGEPLAVYPYHDAEGHVLGYTYRLPTSDGGKEVLPVMWAENRETHERKWNWQAFPEPRPLYGLNRLAAKPNATVLVVEGEKCADVGHAQLPELAVCSWPGGGKAVGKADFSPLAGRRVIVWPDCDAKHERLTKDEKLAGVDPVSKPLLPAAEQPGNKAASHIIAQLTALSPPADVWLVKIPEPGEVPDGWDIADLVAEGVTGGDLANWLRTHARRVIAGADVAEREAGESGASASPNEAKPIETVDFRNENAVRLEFVRRIDECDDFDALVYGLAVEIEAAALRGATKHRLLKDIAKKAGVPLKTLQSGSDHSPPHGGDEDGPGGAIEELNAMHAVVYLAGKVRILTEKPHPETDRPEVTFSGRQDFCLLYENRTEYVGREPVDLGTAWLRHPARREYRGVVFAPGREREYDGVYNLWRGFGVEPIPGDRHQRFMDLVFNAICAGNEEAYYYVVGWMAHLVQKPGELPGASLVMRSGQRTGKGTFAEMLGKLVGHAHYQELTSQNHLTGQFLGHLANALLVHASEAIWGGDRKHEGTLKAMITDPTWLMERKGIDAVSVRNYKRLIVSTNNDFPVPRDADDARFVILDVTDVYKENWAFFDALREDMDSGGLESLMALLLGVDLTDWHPRQIPPSLRSKGWDIKIQTLDWFSRWWFDCLWSGFILRESGYGGEGATYLWPEEIGCQHLREVYDAWRLRLKLPAYSYTDERQIGNKLAKWGIQRARPRDGLGRRWVYRIPPLAEARACFGAKLHIPPEDWEAE